MNTPSRDSVVRTCRSMNGCDADFFPITPHDHRAVYWRIVIIIAILPGAQGVATGVVRCVIVSPHGCTIGSHPAIQ